MSTVLKPATRDLDGDLAICEAATPGEWKAVELFNSIASVRIEDEFIELCVLERSVDAVFIAEARTGWPYAIRRAKETECENDRLRDEINLLKKQLQEQSVCWD